MPTTSNKPNPNVLRALDMVECPAIELVAKLADLENQTKLDDPEAIERKRAVLEAAIARARARRPT